MTKTTTRKQRIIAALTPRRVKRAQARWRRRRQKVAKTRAKLSGIWHGDTVVNGRRRARGKAKAPAQRKPAAAGRPPRPSGRRRPKAAPEKPRQQCDGTCTNSDMDPDEARAKGLCGTCCGRKELVTNWRGKHHHMRCSDCDASGLANVATLRAKRKEDKDRDGQPTRAEAAGKTYGWFGLSGLFTTLFMTYGWAWAGLSGAGSAAIGGAAYRHERRHGTSEHADRSDRKATKRAARDAGCSAACMWSLKPADTCRCPCGGTTHGTAHRRRAAA